MACAIGSKPMRSIGQELSVNAVVEGSVMRSGTTVRITVRLLRCAATRGFLSLWAAVFPEGPCRPLQAWGVRASWVHTVQSSKKNTGLTPRDWRRGPQR
jgi:hypothetical protein